MPKILLRCPIFIHLSDIDKTCSSPIDKIKYFVYNNDRYREAEMYQNELRFVLMCLFLLSKGGIPLTESLANLIHQMNDFFDTDLLLMLECILRILIAGLCGGFIGYERKSRGKDAGIRTHMIVALASCLMMIISQYGFEDFFQYYKNSGIDMRTDPARIAAQIIPGIGFLGAGMTFVHNKTITGLTTAAGIWAVAGIGMAIGCGMYFLGISCAVIIIFIQLILHKQLKFLRIPLEKEFDFLIQDTKEDVAYVLGILKEFNLQVANFSFERRSGQLLEMHVITHTTQDINKTDFMERVYENPNVQSVSL